MNPISIDVVFDLGVKMRTEVLPVSREAINIRLLKYWNGPHWRWKTHYPQIQVSFSSKYRFISEYDFDHVINDFRR